MAQVLRTSQAEVDLLEIWVYIAESGFPDTADRFLDLIDGKCRAIATFPEMGQARPTLAPNLRSFSVANYLLFYRPAKDGIEVVRVLHGARDIEALFHE